MSGIIYDWSYSSVCIFLSNSFYPSEECWWYWGSHNTPASTRIYWLKCNGPLSYLHVGFSLLLYTYLLQQDFLVKLSFHPKRSRRNKWMRRNLIFWFTSAWKVYFFSLLWGEEICEFHGDTTDQSFIHSESLIIEFFSIWWNLAWFFSFFFKLLMSVFLVGPRIMLLKEQMYVLYGAVT